MTDENGGILLPKHVGDFLAKLYADQTMTDETLFGMPIPHVPPGFDFHARGTEFFVKLRELQATLPSGDFRQATGKLAFEIDNWLRWSETAMPEESHD
jgi:hypothetical protein